MSAPVATRPAPGLPRPYHFPSFTRTTLSSGVELLACHLPGRQIVSVRLIMDGGIGREDPAGGGVATLVGRAMTEGTEVRDAAAFAEASERLGAAISVDAGWDSMQASLTVPVSHLSEALALMAEAVRRPSFPGNEVSRLRAERLHDIRQEYAEPSHRAQIAFVQAVYTPDSPYGRPAGGAPETVRGLDRDALVAHYQRFMGPAGATLIVAGNLDDVPVHALTEELFGDWTGPTPPEDTAQVTEAVGQTEVTLVSRPGSVQSALLAGHLGANRLIPDYFPTSLMVAVLGGLFTSRLNLKLREEKGYTYGARAWFDFRRKPGPFGAATAVGAPVTMDALVDMMAELHRMHDEGVSAEELAFAQDYLVGVFPLAFETPEAITQAMARQIVYGLPDDYYQTYRPSLLAVTPEQASAAARTRIHPDRMAIVVVGGPELAQPLQEAGFGPVTVVEDAPPELD